MLGKVANTGPRKAASFHLDMLIVLIGQSFSSFFLFLSYLFFFEASWITRSNNDDDDDDDDDMTVQVTLPERNYPSQSPGEFNYLG